MNPNRKCKQFHFNLEGWAMVNCPEFLELFYCMEEESTKHTHVGLLLKEPMSKNQLLDFLVEQNEGYERHQFHVESHKNWGTIWGYHCGFGGKVPCEFLTFITKTPEQLEEMIADRRHHRKSDSCLQVRLKNLDLLDSKPVELLRAGKINLRGYGGFCKDHSLALQHIQQEMDDQDDVPLAPKKRHHWYHGPSNTGKSTMAKSHGAYFVVPRNNDWSMYKGQKVIILEEYKGAFWKVDTLQELCDCDNYQVNTKGGSKLLARDCIICITSRDDPSVLFSKEDPEDVQGIYNRFFIHHLTMVYPSN